MYNYEVTCFLSYVVTACIACLSGDVASICQKKAKDESVNACQKGNFPVLHMFCKPLEHIPTVQDLFIIKSVIGKGTFGQVFLGYLKQYPNRLYALKYILHSSAPQRIANEVKCLSLLEGCDNIISLETFVRYHDHYVLIMPFFEHDKFTEYISTMNLYEMRGYMRALFLALLAVHELGIIHRDIKPSNCLYNCKEKKLKLIDFGLAQNEDELKVISTVTTDKLSLKQCNLNFHKCQHATSEICSVCYHRPTQISPRNGTSGFRAPEVLLKHPNQTTAIDIWSAGVIFLCLLSGKYPFFKASNDQVAIMQIVTLFGSEKCMNLAQLFHKELTCSQVHHAQGLADICEHLRRLGSNVKQHCSQFTLNASSNTSENLDSIKTGSSSIKSVSKSLSVSESSKHEGCEKEAMNFATPSAYNLLEKCLDLNPFTRITASQALQHPFFKQL